MDSDEALDLDEPSDSDQASHSDEGSDSDEEGGDIPETDSDGVADQMLVNKHDEDATATDSSLEEKRAGMPAGPSGQPAVTPGNKVVTCFPVALSQAAHTEEALLQNASLALASSLSSRVSSNDDSACNEPG